MLVSHCVCVQPERAIDACMQATIIILRHRTVAWNNERSRGHRVVLTVPRMHGAVPLEVVLLLCDVVTRNLAPPVQGALPRLRVKHGFRRVASQGKTIVFSLEGSLFFIGNIGWRRALLTAFQPLSLREHKGDGAISAGMTPSTCADYLPPMRPDS